MPLRSGQNLHSQLKSCANPAVDHRSRRLRHLRTVQLLPKGLRKAFSVSGLCSLHTENLAGATRTRMVLVLFGEFLRNLCFETANNERHSLKEYRLLARCVHPLSLEPTLKHSEAQVPPGQRSPDRKRSLRAVYNITAQSHPNVRWRFSENAATGSQQFRSPRALLQCRRASVQLPEPMQANRG